MSDQTLIVKLTDHGPVQILLAEWPALVDIEYQCEYMVIRRRPGKKSFFGREPDEYLIYGEAGDSYAGVCFKDDPNCPRAWLVKQIRAVANILRPSLAAECIAALPVTDIEEAL